MLFPGGLDPLVGALDVGDAELVDVAVEGSAMPLTCRPMPRAAELRSMGWVSLICSGANTTLQVEVQPGDHGREHRGDERGNPLRRLDPVDHAYPSAIVWTFLPASPDAPLSRPGGSSTSMEKKVVLAAMRLAGPSASHARASK